GVFSAAVPLRNGNYEVTLRMSEQHFNEAGKRRFNVKMEGALKEENLDLWVVGGGKAKPVDRKHVVTVTDGVLNIDFLRGTSAANYPECAAIVIKEIP